VKLGITAFLTDRTMGPAEFATEVEERGFHSLYLPEHTHMPVESAPPTLVDGVNAQDYLRGLDPFGALSAASARTEKILLGTGVSLVAQHDAIVLAKQIATLDHLCAGRFVLGIGFGWNRVEAAHHGIVFDQRRQIAREKLLCMKAIWSQEVEAIVEYGDGWMPIGGAGISDAIVDLKARFETSGRDPAGVRVVPFGTIPSEGKLAHLAGVGCTEVVLRVRGEEASAMRRTLDSYVPYLSREWVEDV
jgi:alkanesulfonate monooxygenase SsuD/methylene tetrahydromethanopterin reductase-like flavin-dependent oxidoreductase (luciferase family)